MQYYEWIIKARDESQEGVDNAKRKMDELAAHSGKTTRAMKHEAQEVLRATSLSAKGMIQLIDESFGKVGIAIGQMAAVIGAFWSAWKTGLKIQTEAWKFFVLSIQEGWTDAEEAMGKYIAALRSKYSGAVKEAHATTAEHQKKILAEIQNTDREMAREEQRSKLLGVIQRRPEYEVERENAEKRIQYEKQVMEKIINEREIAAEKIKEMELKLAEIEKRYHESSRNATGEILRAKRREWEATKEATTKAIEEIKKYIETLNEKYEESEIKILSANAAIIKSEEQRKKEAEKAAEEMRKLKEEEEKIMMERNKRKLELEQRIQDIEAKEKMAKLRAVQKQMEDELARVEERLANIQLGKRARLEREQRRKQIEREEAHEENLRQRMQIRGLVLSREAREWLEQRELQRRREQIQMAIAGVREKMEQEQEKQIAENTKKTAEELVSMKQELQKLLVMK